MQPRGRRKTYEKQKRLTRPRGLHAPPCSGFDVWCWFTNIGYFCSYASSLPLQNGAFAMPCKKRLRMQVRRIHCTSIDRSHRDREAGNRVPETGSSSVCKPFGLSYFRRVQSTYQMHCRDQICLSTSNRKSASTTRMTNEPRFPVFPLVPRWPRWLAWTVISTSLTILPDSLPRWSPPLLALAVWQLVEAFYFVWLERQSSDTDFFSPNDQAQLRAENHAAGENEAAPSGALADAPCSALSADVTP